MNYIFKHYYDAIIKDLSGLIKIPTVYDASTVTAKMPYGKNVYQGYLWMKEKALKDGFEVLEYDGHALAIRIPGNESIDRVDVVSHMDVVEPGEGWDQDPFSGSVIDGCIYGRGAQDMKGSLILTYYALKYIKDNKFPCKKELRVVIGCDEECTMGDMKYYLMKAGEPAFAFTPDGKFPYSMGEKGALMWVVEGSMETCIEELDGGVQCNVVSPSASALVNPIEAYSVYQEMIEKLGYEGEVLKEAGRVKLKIIGKAAHASRPESGLNATVRLLELIREVSHDPLAELMHKCFYDYYGKGADICYDISPMGKLTLNLGLLKIRNKAVTASIDCRYPSGITEDILTEKIQQVLKPLNVALKYNDRPTLVSGPSPYLDVLLATYREISKNPKAEPIIGMGVTYSKVFFNCVAFGPMAEGDLVLAHQANESIDIKKLESLFEIYSQTMIRLANLK